MGFVVWGSKKRNYVSHTMQPSFFWRAQRTSPMAKGELGEANRAAAIAGMLFI